MRQSGANRRERIEGRSWENRRRRDESERTNFVYIRSIYFCSNKIYNKKAESHLVFSKADFETANDADKFYAEEEDQKYYDEEEEFGYYDRF